LWNPNPRPSRRNPRSLKKRTNRAGVAVALVVLHFAFIYPILSDELLTRPEWLARMWFGTWI